MVSDRGPQSVAHFWKAFWSHLGASVSLSSGHHPQSNGETERVNQGLEIYLRCYTSKDPTKWSQNPLWAEIAHNQQWSAGSHLYSSAATGQVYGREVHPVPGGLGRVWTGGAQLGSGQVHCGQDPHPAATGLSPWAVRGRPSEGGSCHVCACPPLLQRAMQILGHTFHLSLPI